MHPGWLVSARANDEAEVPVERRDQSPKGLGLRKFCGEGRVAGGVRRRFTAPEPRLLLGISEPPHPEECDCDPSATRRYRCRWSSAGAPPQGPASELHHGVHEHQPPGTPALSLSKEPGRGRCGEGGGGELRTAAPLSRAQAGGAAQTLLRSRGASQTGWPCHLLSLTVCLGDSWFAGDIGKQTSRVGPNWSDLSNQEELQFLYQEERKSIILAKHYSGQFGIRVVLVSHAVKQNSSRCLVNINTKIAQEPEVRATPIDSLRICFYVCSPRFYYLKLGSILICTFLP